VKNKIKNTFTSNIKVHFVILLIIMLAANFCTPRIVDDLGQKVTDGVDFATLFSYIERRYFSWSGRVIADFNNSFFLGIPKGVFNIINAVFYVLFIYLLCRHSFGANKPEKKKVVLLFLIAQVLVFFNIPNYGQVILWESGASNYLWNGVFMLAFLLPYRCYSDGAIRTQNEKVIGYYNKHKVLFFFLSFFGIVAGWTNENTAGGLIFLEVMFVLQLLFHKKRVPVFLWTGLGTSILGFAAMILAPGNYIRQAKDIAHKPMAHTSNTIENIAKDIVGIVKVYMDYPGLRYVLISFIALVAVLIVIKRTEGLQTAMLYAVVSLLVTAAYSATGQSPFFHRGLFGSSFFFIIAVLILVKELTESRVGFQTSAVISSVLVIFMILQGLLSGIGVVSLYQQETIRQKYAMEQSAKGNKNPTIPLIERTQDSVWNPFNGLQDISSDPTYWTNSCFNNYFHTESVVATDRERWRHFYQNGNPSLMNITNRADYIKKGLKQPGLTNLIVLGERLPLDLKTFLKENGVNNPSDVAVILVKNKKVISITKATLIKNSSLKIGKTVIKVQCSGKKVFFTSADFTWSDNYINNSAVISFDKNSAVCDYVLLNAAKDRVVR
jgi:hypothetical protein